MSSFGRGNQARPFRWGSGRGDRGGSRGHGGRGGSANAARAICHHFQAGRCRFGSTCKFSHEMPANGEARRPFDRATPNAEETFGQREARANYNTWKRLLKSPPLSNDTSTMDQLWQGALDILNGDDLDWKQMLPRDLDNEEYCGRQHMLTLLTMQSGPRGSKTFIDLSRPFLLVVTHSSLLDSLTVDTNVGAIYNFFSGANGTRAISFLQRLCEALHNIQGDQPLPLPQATIETTLIAASHALFELLRREQRARLNDDLQTLVDLLEALTEMITDDTSAMTSQLLSNRIVEIRAVAARARALLRDEEDPSSDGVSTTAVAAAYPRELVVPRDRHDNDKREITGIKIFPTLQEILSNDPEFLPSTDFDQPHFIDDQAARHVDTNFRLLRHDTFGELKEALGTLLHGVEEDPSLLDHPGRALRGMRAHCYPKARISYVSFDGRRGLEAQISFHQLAHLRKSSASERRKWWDESKRLSEGVLMSFVAIRGTEVSHLFLTVSERSTDPKKEHSLTCDNFQATITVKLAGQDQADVETMIHLSCHNTRGLLVEFPGALPATFLPILQNLQNMQRLGRLPFRQWVLPDRITESQGTPKALDIPPPRYAQKHGFEFSLSSIMKPNISPLFISPTSLPSDGSVLDEVDAKTNLDRGQCRALLAALTREFAFIQGPPGTGKSYLGVQLMRVLLECKSKADLGPIIVICYTNHALDQFLEHLHAIGITKIIRMGGQSQSKVLEGNNLKIVSQTESKTKAERYIVAKTYEALARREVTIKSWLGRLHGLQKHVTWANFDYHLRSEYPRIHSQFSAIDDEGFQLVGRDPFEQWRTAGGLMALESGDLGVPTFTSAEGVEILRRATENVHSLSHRERRELLGFWTQEIHDSTADELFEEVNNAESLQRHLTNVHDDVDRRILQDADVIGVTTTGLAKRISTLQRVRCKVVICEEAGEVMEPHMISALLPTVEHFIQIGDHEQLRPQINNYGLSLESNQGAAYQLDRSQFERLSVGERGRRTVPVAQLDVQRRMRPEISRLIRETIYPRLIDHRTIYALPHVVGMRQDVFWLDHEKLEDGEQSEIHHKSHSNIWEVDMVHALVRHIIRQGEYSSSEIAVLTPYTGQLQKLRSAMRNDFEVVLSERDQETLAKEGFGEDEPPSKEESPSGQPSNRLNALEKKKLSDLLRVATVDNFQGEEAKIIIVSLVRSNKERKVGFLKTTNRINVLLSRAQHGMYLIGNSDTYSNIPMWQKVLNMLRATNSVGESFSLCCPRHPDTEIQVREPDDFSRLSPEGGCILACNRRLPDCGHRCQARCHSESMHRVFACPQPCQRLHSPCNHSCQKPTCGEDCGNCLIRLNDIQLPCGHTKDDVPCFLTRDLGKIRCEAKVRKRVPGCDHHIEVSCSQDVTSQHFRCPTPCTEILPCGHACPGTCGKCHGKDGDGQPRVSHMTCRKICGRAFAACNHTCRQPCHADRDCGLCLASCEVRCAHSACDKKCHEPCAPCIEKCTWSCEHRGACSMPCSAPCDRLPCDQRCSKTLSCGHQCPGICGETCPEKYCHKCSDKQDARVDLLLFKSYNEIDVDESPIVVLGCGHFFTAESLDGVVKMKEVYTQNLHDAFTDLADISGCFATAIPLCPDCRRPIRQYATQRYNRLVNRAVMDEWSRRFLVNSKAELGRLEDQLKDLEQALEKERSAVVKIISGANLALAVNRVTTRYEASRSLEKAIRNLQLRVSEKHQPAHKLHEATVQARRSRSLEHLMTDVNLHDSVPPVERDRRIALGSRQLEIKVQCIILEDKFTIAQEIRSASAPSQSSLKFPGGAPHQLASPLLRSCKKFIGDCEADSLPKLAVEASLQYARIARLFESSAHSQKVDLGKASEYVQTAKELLGKAQELCKEPFQSAETLRIAVAESLKLLRRQWYEEVTAEELASIKAAMVSGHSGIATHSGHWYNCENGHPFAIGECGMPMELARCPECGRRIGGQHHQAVQGVERATNMEM